jgi:hypothetical protein
MVAVIIKMKKLFTHSIALVIGLIVGYFLFNIDTQRAIETAKHRNDISFTLSRLGDINKLKKEGFGEAAKLFESSLFLRLGIVGNYYREKSQTPTESEWIFIDPALEYFRNNMKASQVRNYVEASRGVSYLISQKRLEE